MAKAPVGVVALTAFFVFGATMAGTACLALLFPASEWSRIWQLNPDAQAAFQAMGPWAIVLMFCVAAACALSAIGLSRRALWGHRLAIAVLLVNLAGDLGNAIGRGDARTLIGLPIAGAMIGYLMTPGIKRHFRS